MRLVGVQNLLVPAKKDGKWHAIRVEVTHPDYVVRARKGYVATP